MTTNKPILPLFCSTPPPDDFVLDENDDVIDFAADEDDQKESQLHEHSTAPDNEIVNMSSFTLCDDDEEEQKSGKSLPSKTNVESDFKIEIVPEILQNITENLNKNFEKTVDTNVQKEPDIEEDFGNFQDCSALGPDVKETTEPLDHNEAKTNILSVSELPSLQNITEEEEEEKYNAEAIDSQFFNDNIEKHSEKISVVQDKLLENDNFDEFEDFESFSVTKNEIKTLVQTNMEPQAIQFEADFSQFQEFEETPQQTLEVNDFDDDFDDFQDFTSAPALPAQHSETFPQIELIENISKRIEPVLDMMFPKKSEQESTTQVVNSLNDFAILIKQVDSALALDFQWKNSDIRKKLVQSIGVDSRGITYENWNPNMPRFAANLSMAPLEPLKPVKSEGPSLNAVSASSIDEIIKPVASTIEKPKTTDIPAVEFDWNSSGLVNPLDGPEETINSGKVEEIHTSQLKQPNDEHLNQKSELQISTELGPSISNSIPAAASFPTKQQQNVIEGCVDVDFGLTNNLQSECPAAATSTTYSGTFKETHIFTPPKTESISRSRTKSKSPIDFDFETAAAGIIIDEKVINKEYRDVEYKPPSPPPKSQPVSVLCMDDEFSDFQSVGVSQGKVPANVQKVKELESRTSTPNSLAESEMILSPAVLLPQTVQIEKSSNTKIEWPEPGINSDEMARLEQFFSKPNVEKSIDEDEWCDFVSNTESISQTATSATTYQDDEWSDFVSSVPASNQPQFNSGAWQNANYYNNPLSVYASTHSNYVPNENNNNISITMGNSHNYNNVQQNHQSQATNVNKNQFLNYNKVAPSISLIPDLGFVAPPSVPSGGRFLNNFQNANFQRK